MPYHSNCNLHANAVNEVNGYFFSLWSVLHNFQFAMQILFIFTLGYTVFFSSENKNLNSLTLRCHLCKNMFRLTWKIQVLSRGVLLYNKIRLREVSRFLLCCSTVDFRKDPQSATKLLRHCCRIGELQRTKQSTPLPSPLHSKLGCLLFSTGRKAAQHCMEGMDEGNLYFSF